MFCSRAASAAGICRRAMATCSSVGSRQNYFRSVTTLPCCPATARQRRSAQSGGRTRSCADRHAILAPLIVLRDGDVERFFDVMKFRVHVLDIFAKTKPVDGFTA